MGLLTQLARHVPYERLDDVRALAERTEDPGERLGVLAGRETTEPARLSGYRDAIAALRALRDDREKREAVAGIARECPPAVARELIEICDAITPDEKGAKGRAIAAVVNAAGPMP